MSTDTIAPLPVAPSAVVSPANDALTTLRRHAAELDGAPAGVSSAEEAFWRILMASYGLLNTAQPSEDLDGHRMHASIRALPWKTIPNPCFGSETAGALLYDLGLYLSSMADHAWRTEGSVYPSVRASSWFRATRTAAESVKAVGRMLATCSAADQSSRARFDMQALRGFMQASGDWTEIFDPTHPLNQPDPQPQPQAEPEAGLLSDLQGAAEASDTDPAVSAQTQTATRWCGILAPLNTRSSDDRIIADTGEINTRDMPLPLMYQAVPVPGSGHYAAEPAGLITRVWTQKDPDGTLYLRGEGLASGALAQRIEAGETVSLGVDLDEVVGVLDDATNAIITQSWRLISATCYVSPIGVFPDAAIWKATS